VAAEKPMILSDTRALREYFHKGAVYTDNTYQDVAAKISEAIKNTDKLRQDVKELKQDKLRHWRNIKAETETILSGLIRRG
jgi:glycosyltransferase involved in cell wall biosynthesis